MNLSLFTHHGIRHVLYSFPYLHWLQRRKKVQIYMRQIIRFLIRQMWGRRRRRVQSQKEIPLHTFCPNDFKYQDDELNKKYVFMSRRTKAVSPFHIPALPYPSNIFLASSVPKNRMHSGTKLDFYRKCYVSSRQQDNTNTETTHCTV